jgi:hypothetical protein
VNAYSPKTVYNVINQSTSYKKEGNMDDALIDVEALLNTVSELFVYEGSAKEVAILANADGILVHTEHDNWNGGWDLFKLELNIPTQLFMTVYNEVEQISHRILEKVKTISLQIENIGINYVSIHPKTTLSSDWREKHKNWVEGKGVTNQGRVRSDNIPSRSCDGLLFRSEPEIILYKALKASGVSFAPLPVFIRGGSNYRRIEPDFIIIKNGIVLHVEVDGDTVHTESPQEAHERATMLSHEGAFLERVKASECASDYLAGNCADKLIKLIDRHKASK